MEQVDCVVIGAGVIGLAVACALTLAGFALKKSCSCAIVRSTVWCLLITILDDQPAGDLVGYRPGFGLIPGWKYTRRSGAHLVGQCTRAGCRQGRTRILRVGARGVVHTPQFNGKQEGQADQAEPNLRCPRNGKWTNLDRFRCDQGHWVF